MLSFKAVQKIYQNREVLFQHLNDESVGAVFQMFLILLETEEGYMLVFLISNHIDLT